MNARRIKGHCSNTQQSIPALDLASKTDLPRRSALTKGARTLEIKEIKEIKAIIDLMKKHDLSVFEIEKEGSS